MLQYLAHKKHCTGFSNLLNEVGSHKERLCSDRHNRHNHLDKFFRKFGKKILKSNSGRVPLVFKKCNGNYRYFQRFWLYKEYFEK